MEATLVSFEKCLLFYLWANEVPNTNPKEDISMVVTWATGTEDGGTGLWIYNMQPKC